MKKSIYTLIIALFVAVSPALAQEVVAPKSGAIIHLDTKKLEIAPGETQLIDVVLVRSDRARKVKFSPIAVRGNEAVSFKLVEKEGEKDAWQLEVTATDAATEGAYYYVLSSRGNSAHKVKGTTMTVKVNKEAVARNNK